MNWEKEREMQHSQDSEMEIGRRGTYLGVEHKIDNY